MAQAYVLQEVERDDGVSEVTMMDGSGYRIEVHFDPVTSQRPTGPRRDD